MSDPHHSAPDDQREVVAFLRDPATHGGRDVLVRETHGAVVVLVGEDAWKIKRAITYPYMDLSTPAARRAMCEAEVAANRPFAADLYRGVVPIVRRPDGTLALGGDGDPVEWAVHMRRFSETALLSHIVAAGRLDQGLADRIADAIAGAHAAAPVHREVDWAARLRQTIDAVLGSFDGDTLLAGLAADLRTLIAAALQRHHDRLMARSETAWVRRCHGDLHLDNVVVRDATPCLFDALEFDPDIATTDVFYDLAFLLMDLRHRGCDREANGICNRYLWRRQQDDDIAALPLMPVYMAVRAAIRAMANLQRSRLLTPGAGGADRPRTAARAYLDTAQEILRTERPTDAPRLIAIGGLSGTGKSTLARRVAPALGPAPGALHLRSDLERKALAGVEETERLAPSSYTPQSSAAVYAVLGAKAARALKAKHDVVVDAVFARPEERAAIAAVARDAGASFLGIWLRAPLPVLIERVSRRRGDASDADAAVVGAQARWGATGAGWLPLQASEDPDWLARRVRAIITHVPV